MNKYNVTFAYSILVEAESADEAEKVAIQRWDEIMPRTDEMNINVEEERR